MLPSTLLPSCIFCTVILVSPTLSRPKEDNPISSSSEIISPCRPEPNPNHAQYIIGYGSLMQSQSKTRTAPNTGSSIPVLVDGFRREWNTQGKSVGMSTTYLGVVEDQWFRFNAIIFKLSSTDEDVNDNSNSTTLSRLVETLRNYDLRESWYCRQKVPKENVQILVKDGENQSILADADFWIYVNKPEFTNLPTKKYPIVQSYVDLFMSGCLEIQMEHNLPNFAAFCIGSTHGWSKEWINDRIYPRRPFLFQPKAADIDEILAKRLPETYSHIAVETFSGSS